MRADEFRVNHLARVLQCDWPATWRQVTTPSRIKAHVLARANAQSTRNSSEYLLLLASIMSSPSSPISPCPDGYYHPSNEKQLCDLVKFAYDNSLQFRVRGSGHSMPQAIFTDVCDLDHVNILSKPPEAAQKNINVKLDEYFKITDIKGNLVTVQAGIHLSHCPDDPNSTVENSLLHQLHYNYGLTVDDLGGISRQTVGGFLSTGSAGGSLKYDILENVHAMRIIDGTGSIYEVSRDDENTDLFFAALVSLGVLGVLSTVTFQCVKTFNIKGTQTCDALEECNVDILSDVPRAPRIGLIPFMKKTEYTRIFWWPQRCDAIGIKHQRVQVWQAHRDDNPLENPDPFKVFQSNEIMLLGAYVMLLMGNFRNVDRVRKLMPSKIKRFEPLMIQELEACGMCEQQAKRFVNGTLNRINGVIMEFLNNVVKTIPDGCRPDVLPAFSAGCVSLFALLDKFSCSQPLHFRDYGWHGLPMDNTADDVIFATMFTEIWVPLSRATAVTNMLHRYFENESPWKSYTNTGNNAWELYCSKSSKAWMSMSFSGGEDEWAEGSFRIDPMWFVENEGDARELFRPVWVCLRQLRIPFRLHWGKVFPSMDDTKEVNWPKVLVQDQYPRLKEFLDFRDKKDPKGIFLNNYWRHWLGLPKKT